MNKVLITEEVEVANHLNFFYKVADNLDSNLPPDNTCEPCSNKNRLPVCMQLFPAYREECFTHIQSLKRQKNTEKIQYLLFFFL